MNYYKKLDKELKLIPLTFKAAFDKLFKSNLNLLKLFCIDALEIDITPNNTSIRCLDEKIPSENPNRVIIILSHENNLFDGNKEEIKNNITEAILNSDNTLRIELTTIDKLKGNPNLGEIYRVFLDKTAWKTGEVKTCYDETLRIDGKDLLNISFQSRCIANYKTLYSVLKTSRMVNWYALLASQTFEELYEIASRLLDEKDVDKFMNYAIKISRNELIISDWINSFEE